MANEFIARKGLVVLTNGATITGSLNTQGNINATGYTVTASAYTGSFTGTFIGSASYATNALTASFALTTAGTVLNATSASYAETASYALNSTGATFPFSGSAVITGSLVVTDENGILSLTLENSTIKASSGEGAIIQSDQYVELDWIPNEFTSSFLGVDNTGVYASVGENGYTFTFGNDGNFVLPQGELIGTSSWAQKAVSSSFATTASFAPTILPTGVVSSSTQVAAILPTGTVSSSGQVSYTGLSNIPVGIVSSSAQVTANLPVGVVSSSGQVDVRNTTGIATIATTGSNTFTGIQNITNSTNSTIPSNGALVVSGGLGVGGNVNISGSLTVLGLLTAVSTSIQYITSSQLIVADNKIVVNTTDLIRFGGLSVYDSGSSATTASIFWDSLNHKFIYENFAGLGYNSGMFIAGPANTGTLGNEVGLVAGRIPVASGDDHIDSRIVSSSIRVDFPSRFTHIEAGLYVTGGVTASAGFTGSFRGEFPGSALVSSSAQVTSLLPTGTYSSSTQLPTGIISSSTQLPTGTVSSSGQVSYTGLSNIPVGIVSSSTQFTSITAPFTGSFTGSFRGDGSNLTGIATTLNASGSAGGGASVSLQTQTLLISGANGIGVSGSGQSIIISGSNATTTTRGVASFTASQFSVTNGEVSANNITINGTAVTLGGTRNITLQQITTQGSSTTDIVSLTNGAIIVGALYSSSTKAGVSIGTEVIATVSTGSYNAAFFDYYISSASNYRAGTVTSVWQPGTANIEFTDVSTNDIGNTLGLNMTVDLLNDLARLKATVNSSNWTVKTAVRAL